MDNLWQRHRTFILKILGGLGFCLFAWIVGSSLSGPGLDRQVALIESKRGEIQRSEVHSQETIRAYRDGAEILQSRILPLAAAVGETRQGEDLRIGLLKELLAAVGKEASDLSAYLSLSRQSPQACLTRLVGDAASALRREAALRNVFIDEELGFDKVQVGPGELDRYLLTLKKIVEAVRLGIEEGAFEVRNIGILSPSGGRFAGEDTFVREYPFAIDYRAPTGTLLRLIDRMNDPAHFLPVQTLRRFQHEQRGASGDVMVMSIELKALRILPTESL